MGTHCVGSWVGSRAGLEELERRKLFTVPGLELQPLGHSTSLYTD
jgi:hypothetical protein